MKKAIKIIAASILLLNTTSIVNNKMIAVQAMNSDQPNLGDKDKQNQNKTNQNQAPQTEGDKIVTQVAADIGNLVGDFKKTSAENLEATDDIVGKTIQEEIAQKIEKNLDNKLNEIISEVNNAIAETPGSQLVSNIKRLTELNGEHANERCDALQAQIKKLEQINATTAKVMITLVNSLKQITNSIFKLQGRFGQKPNVYTKETAEAIVKSLQDYQALPGIITSQNEIVQKHEAAAKKIKEEADKLFSGDLSSSLQDNKEEEESSTDKSRFKKHGAPSDQEEIDQADEDKLNKSGIRVEDEDDDNNKPNTNKN